MTGRLGLVAVEEEETMTEEEARKILEEYCEFDKDTGEKCGHKIIRCLGSNRDCYNFECKSNGWLDLNTMTFVESPDATYEVAVQLDGTVICIPQ